MYLYLNKWMSAHLCVIHSERVCVSPNRLTDSGWLSTAEPIDHQGRRKMQKEEKTQIVVRRDADYLMSSSITDIFFTLATFSLFNVTLSCVFLPHKAVFFLQGWQGFGWRRDRVATMETKHITDMSIPDGTQARQ